jgi:thiol-disulfide isomerase/thioredoxin
MLLFSNGGAKAKAKSKGKTKGKGKTIKMGRVHSPVDVRSKTDVAGFETLLEKGPLTIVLVYADWCGACHRFKENKWNNVLSMKNRTMNISSVREDMLGETSLANAKVPHYPTLLLVGKDKKPAEFTMPNGEVTNALPPEAKENVSQIVQTPIPELPEPESMNALVNEVVSAPPANATVGMNNSITRSANGASLASVNSSIPTNNAVVNGTVLPPAMTSDLQQSIQNATAVANKPSKNIIGGGLSGGFGGGLYSALQKIVVKSTAAFKLKRKTRKYTTHKPRKTLRKRNKAGRFSRRR